MTTRLAMEQVRLLYQRSPSALLIAVVAAAVLAFVLALRGDVPPLSAALWCVAMAAVILWRARLLRAFNNDQDLANSWRHWLRRFDVAVVATGLVWGVGCAAFFLAASDMGRTITLLFAVTAVASAIHYLSPVLKSYLIYLASVIGPLVGAYLWESSVASITYAALSIVLVTSLVLVARLTNGFIVSQLYAHFENRALARDLAASNAQLERDVEKRKRIESLLSIEKSAFEKVAMGAPLQECLDDLNRSVQSVFPGTISAVLLSDDSERHLYVGSAPLLDDEFWRAVDGLVIGPRSGTCGTAAYLGHSVVTRDTETDPLWQDYRGLARQHGLRACWATPILSSNSRILGTFSMYYRVPREPSEEELAYIKRLSYIVGIAIQHDRTETALRDSEERFREFAELGADWFWELGRDLKFTYVSKGHELATGIDIESVIGRRREELYRDAVATGDRTWAAHLEDMAARRPFDIEFQTGHADGSRLIIRTVGQPRFNGAGKFLGYRGIGRDVTGERRLAEQMAFLATHDPMTGLKNRRAFEERLQRTLERSGAEAEMYLAFIDFDKYKFVNDSIGHVAGDRLLEEFAEFAVATLGADDVVGRIGGDEFGMLIKARDAAHLNERVDRLLQAVRGFRFRCDERQFDVRVSIGVVPVTSRYNSVASLLSDADFACSRAKESGGDRCSFYDRERDVHTRRLREFVSGNALAQALKEDRFLLYSQPIVALEEVAGDNIWHEVLLRVVDDDGELISPAWMIQAAERYGQMSLIDQWVFSKALAAHAEHLDNGDEIRLSINLSASSIARRDTLPFIKDQLANYGVPGHALCIEITETSAIANLKEATNFVTELRKHGCLFALDDFGAGLSSFAYLKHLPVDFLKIDGEFVRDLGHAETNVALVSAMNQLGRALGISTVAEWVERESDVGTLRSMGVTYGQGSIFGEPQPLTETLSSAGTPISLRA